VVTYLPIVPSGAVGSNKGCPSLALSLVCAQGILVLVLRKYKHRTPHDLLANIEQHMLAPIQTRGEELHVEWIKHIRDFKTWIADAGCGLSNPFVSRVNTQTGMFKMAAHSFTYKLRMDLSDDENVLLLQGGLPRNVGQFGEHQFDVFAVVKGRMKDTAPNGPPVLVLPNSRSYLVTAGGPRGTCYKHPIAKERQAELEGLADALEEATAAWEGTYSYVTAARELRCLAAGRDSVRPPTHWLEASGAAPIVPVELTSNPYFSHLPAASWRLLSHFRRL